MARRRVSSQTAARRARAVELRDRRWTWAAIGEDLGVSLQRAHQLYREALDDVPVMHVDEHRRSELDLIDTACRELMDIAAAPYASSKDRIRAWATLRMWADRKARLLGLDAPQRILTMDQLDDEIERLTREMEAEEREARLSEFDRAAQTGRVREDPS
jgi:hypothetical protein